MSIKEIRVPDIGGATAIDVIEILVKIGDKISLDQAVLTLESDKATMDVPASQAGTVTTIKVKVGDKVSEGDVIFNVETAHEVSAVATTSAPKPTAATAQTTTVPPTLQLIKVPDIGGASSVDVIEILVKVGDTIKVDDSLVTLESDKATMDVPAPQAGLVISIALKVGDKVSEGDVILSVETVCETSATTTADTADTTATTATLNLGVATAHAAAIPATSQLIKIPDIGGAVLVDVIEILVKVGDTIKVDDSLVTLESDKATMDVPAPQAGLVISIALKVGDKVSEGMAVLTLQPSSAVVPATADAAPAKIATVEVAPIKVATASPIAPAGALPVAAIAPPHAVAATLSPTSSTADTAPVASLGVAVSSVTPADKTFADWAAYDQNIVQKNSSLSVYAGPTVRRLAREFGIDLTQVRGSGRKQRIVTDDIRNFVKSRLRDGIVSSHDSVASGRDNVTNNRGTINNGLNLLPWPTPDFSKFGALESVPLQKIRRLTAANLQRNWVTIPHVTQFDEADITVLEAYRQAHKAEAEQQGYKLTPLIFIIKALVAALKKFPYFNASLDASGEILTLKKYFNVGVAIDTPYGLVVPVVRNVDKKSLEVLAKELAALSQKARQKGLTIQDMQGGNFTISSLGGISGTAFTPIVNAPDVAILGVSKAQIKPVYVNEQFVPRLMLPLSLSYDHRVIDGADGARFTRYLCEYLANTSGAET